MSVFFVFSILKAELCLDVAKQNPAAVTNECIKIRKNAKLHLSIFLFLRHYQSRSLGRALIKKNKGVFYHIRHVRRLTCLIKLPMCLSIVYMVILKVLLFKCSNNCFLLLQPTKRNSLKYL